MPKCTTIDGVTLNYERWGVHTAPRVLVLLPSATTLAELKPTISGPGAAAKLDREYSCVAFDYRGIGESSSPSAAWPTPSVGVFVDDALAVLEHVGWKSCHIIAFSFGAAVAQELLLRRSRFSADRVLLVCPAVDIDKDGTGAGSVELFALLSLDAEGRAEKMLRLADTRRDWAWLDSDEGGAAMWYVRRIETTLAQKPGGVEGRRYQYESRKSYAVIARLREAAGLGPEDEEAPSDMAPHAAAPNSTAIATEEKSLLAANNSPKRSAPPLYESCLILGSVFDGISPPAALKRLHAALPGSSLLWFEAGHWPNLARERQVHFGSTALAFLAGRPAPKEVVEASSVAAEKIRPPGKGLLTECFGAGDCVVL